MRACARACARARVYVCVCDWGYHVANMMHVVRNELLISKITSSRKKVLRNVCCNNSDTILATHVKSRGPNVI